MQGSVNSRAMQLCSTTITIFNNNNSTEELSDDYGCIFHVYRISIPIRDMPEITETCNNNIIIVLTLSCNVSMGLYFVNFYRSMSVSCSKWL